MRISREIHVFWRITVGKRSKSHPGRSHGEGRERHKSLSLGGLELVGFEDCGFARALHALRLEASADLAIKTYLARVIWWLHPPKLRKTKKKQGNKLRTIKKSLRKTIFISR